MMEKFVRVKDASLSKYFYGDTTFSTMTFGITALSRMTLTKIIRGIKPLSVMTFFIMVSIMALSIMTLTS